MYWASLVAQLEKNLPAVQETQVQFLGWEDSLQREMAILENPMDRGAWLAIVHGVTSVRHNLETKLLLCTDYPDSTFIAIWPVLFHL